MLFVLKHTEFGMSLFFSELIRTQQAVTLFGPAFSSPAIWSVIFQVLPNMFDRDTYLVVHFPCLAFYAAPSGPSELWFMTHVPEKPASQIDSRNLPPISGADFWFHGASGRKFLSRK